MSHFACTTFGCGRQMMCDCDTKMCFSWFLQLGLVQTSIHYYYYSIKKWLVYSLSSGLLQCPSVRSSMPKTVLPMNSCTPLPKNTSHLDWNYAPSLFHQKAFFFDNLTSPFQHPRVNNWSSTYRNALSETLQSSLNSVSHRTMWFMGTSGFHLIFCK